MLDGVTFALPKGRLFAPALRLLAQAGVAIQPLLAAHDRRLLIELQDGNRVLLAKPIDVPTYVERGIADVGVAGSDILEEQARDLYEPIDLRLGVCRLVVAESIERRAQLHRGMTLRVGTKYPRLARRHYLQRGIDPDIIELWGSVELGAITGLVDQIVDLVESGATLRQNGLIEVETVQPVTSRLIVHPASLKLRPQRITAIVEALRRAIAHGPPQEVVEL